VNEQTATGESSSPRTTPEDQLAALGFAVPSVAAPVAAYVPAIRTGSYIYTSGQLPLRDGDLIRTGKVGIEVSPEEAYECAQQCVLNALAAIRAETGALSAIARLVKVLGFVPSPPSFTAQPQVVNGASDLLGKAFGDVGQHARSAVGVAVLPLDAPVEIEMVVEVR
jgi:enamine deaminase RidA (YjgF/YER057c/UK114 family)